MIIQSTMSGIVITNATIDPKEPNHFMGYVRNVNDKNEKYYVSQEHAEQLFTGQEVQQKIDYAVQENMLSETPYTVSYVKSLMIERDKCRNEFARLELDTNTKVAKLENEIEELKAKVPQPVEISQDLFNAIEYIKVKHKEWENVFLDFQLPVHYLKFDSVDAEALSKTFRYERLEIIKNGYTVNPDPLREGIASLVARYTNDDGIKDETDLIDKLAEYARDHFSE